jgi:WD40 repeat protein
LSDEIVTAATLNFEEDTLITGHEEGNVKIWDVTSGFMLREQLIGFKSTRGKVKQVLVTHDNTLYAVGSDGCVKLMRAFV